ncbi:MAG: tyrosine--tRNA ligase [Patescibacteria group bacterium]
MDVFQELQERGFVAQCSNEAGLRVAFSKGKVSYYIGFDPTATSLHVGSLVPLMAMAHLQKAGHIPIAVLGGGTAMVGDPSGKTEVRPILAHTEILRNARGLLGQMKRYLVLDGKRGKVVDNGSWLLKISLVNFLREVGSRFRVNEMLRAEGYRERLLREEGLSFLEFSYQLLQGYDFLTLFGKEKCVLQMGGNDQWGNILAGVDLIRRVRGKEAFALTFPLIVTASGRKMGKTEKGAVWLDAKRTSPYGMYQYWINTDDRDVGRFLRLFTFLPLAEIQELEKLEGADLRRAKDALAYEATTLCHGKREAQKAREASRQAFGGKAASAELPTLLLKPMELGPSGISIITLLLRTELSKSKSEARRLLEQGGILVNDKKISDANGIFFEKDFADGALVLRKGKKQFRKVRVVV